MTGICFLDPVSKEMEKDSFLWNNDAPPELGIQKAMLLEKILSLFDKPA